MQYLALIYGNEAEWDAMSEEEQGRVFGKYMEFTREGMANGKVLGGEALQPVTTATTVTVRDGKTITTDGPFAETREQLGGYYVIEADDLDEAISWAARIPGAETGSVEVRPIMPTPSE